MSAVETTTLRTDSALADTLIAELDGMIRDAKETLVKGLEFKEYQQACGMIEAYNQMRHVLIPQTLEAMQRS